MTQPLFVACDKSGARKIFEYGGTNLLMSYWFIRTNTENVLKDIYAERVKHSKLDGIFMLDSGAFSAWKNGSEILLFDYIDFIKKYHQHFTHIVCLDVIDNPIYSEVNHLIMLRELKNYNLEIIPVFHSGEPFAVLDYMVEKGYKYIGISPNNNWKEKAKREWLHRVYTQYDFEKLGIKTHGFGYQSISGLMLFPMTTADATTWKVGEMFGEVIDPEVSSTRTKFTEGLNGIHVDNTPGGYSDFVIELCAELGVSPDEMRTDYHIRDKYNVAATIKLLQRNKSVISSHIDLMSEAGYSDGFSEDKIIEFYKLAVSLGREYTGSPEIQPKVKQQKVVKQNDLEVLF